MVISAPQALARALPRSSLRDLLTLSLMAAGLSLAAAEPSAEQALEAALPILRAERKDLSIRVDRWDAALTIPLAESLLEDPLKIPTVMESRAKAAAEAASSAELLRRAAALLFDGELAIPRGGESAKDPIDRLAASLAAAQEMAGRAADSLAPAERARASELILPWLLNDPSDRGSAADFARLAPFDVPLMLSAAAAAAQAVDDALPSLRAAPAAPARARRPSPSGDILVSNEDEAVFTAEDLRGVLLLVHRGRKSSYREWPLPAEGKLRAVVDFAPEIEVAASSGPGAGIFSVDLAYFPEPGRKAVRAGDFALGAGMFGVGAVFMESLDGELIGGRFSQGAGAFGLGVLAARGRGNRYAVRFGGQGFGFTKGAGLFRHEGDGAVLDGGESEPDPHETVAALSLSQGAGFGPRAYAGGGVGLALVLGDSNSLRASYMAQGMGYWHGLGGLFVRGNANALQARRYVQGAGVHTAVGWLGLRGDRNRLAAWGVGPANGWDFGAGVLDAAGDGNWFSSEWGSGHGDVNGHALAVIRGSRNRVALADLGSGQFKRGAPSYGLALVLGEGNLFRAKASNEPIRAALADPWGALIAEEGLKPVPGLERFQPEWRAPAREEAFRRDRRRMERLLGEAQSKPGKERIGAWLKAASQSGLDGQAAMEGALLLLGLSSAEAAFLPELLAPEKFDSYLWLRTVIPAYGEAVRPSLIKKAEEGQGLERALALDLLRYQPASLAVPIALAAAADSDWRVRRQAAGMLGHVLDRDESQRTGRLRLLEWAEGLCRRGAAEARRELPALREQVLTDFFSILSLSSGFSADERRALLARMSDPFATVSEETIREFSEILARRAPEYLGVVRAELEDSRKREPRARAALRRLLGDPEPEVAHAALLALGGLGLREDADDVALLLGGELALLREGAAAALGRMGEAALGVLRKELRGADARRRALAAVACSRSGSPEVLAELEGALKDSEEQVRSAAAAAILGMTGPLRESRGRFRGALRAMSKNDPSSTARWTAARALESIGD